jgi:hypothetical protein
MQDNKPNHDTWYSPPRKTPVPKDVKPLSKEELKKIGEIMRDESKDFAD